MCMSIQIVLLSVCLCSAKGDTEGKQTQGEAQTQAERLYRAWSPFQRGWKSLLKGTRVVRKNDDITLYRKHGRYGEALEDFYALNPSNVRPAAHGQLIGTVDDTDIYFRGRVNGRNEPEAFQALLMIPSKNEAPKIGLTSKTRKLKGIQYYSRVH